ncbi:MULTISPECIES: tetratricopeptide repeat-containing sulfotransferase family protein [Mameliella]|uniref:tetratricopeptide repeat-containing sulfotransferase family protein n=1 Tax=Mameliella TaxID=1434019 RepID=UPI000B5380C3|nr:MULTISPECIES: sulfotransferase [Mameliella]MCR9272279.1 sulfotransferase [Paracoccaceae bacterium]OWV61715.1 sulfotransferase family protein [Mameliella alba]
MTPQQIKTQFGRALSQISKGQLDPAEVTLKSLLLPTKGAPEVHFHLSRIAEARGDTKAQALELDRALAKKPYEKTLLKSAIEAYSRLEASDKVLGLYDRLISADPKSNQPRGEKAVYLQHLGRFDEAEKILRSLVKRVPRNGEIYRVLGSGRKMPKGDPLLEQMLSLWKDDQLPEMSRMHLGFALAKAVEDIGATEKVFVYLNRANALQRQQAPYDPAEREAEWRAYLDAQESDDYTTLGHDQAPRAVFVTGMPRSGTTLVEQIIASHSQAHAGGEMGHALKQAVAQFGPAQKMTPLAKLSEAKLSHWAEAYTRLVRRDTGQTEGVVTDKSIQTHMVFGLIARGLPGARIIVVHRDPRDTALSIYKNHFKLGTHRYATDLADIADAIKMFRRSVEHWKQRIPDRIHEVRYDDLVSDPEPNARALVDAAGLDWEEACLNFHNSKSGVKTLSLMQVRQPIHAGRREAWRKYERELAPFIEAWGDEPWD